MKTPTKEEAEEAITALTNLTRMYPKNNFMVKASETALVLLKAYLDNKLMSCSGLEELK